MYLKAVVQMDHQYPAFHQILVTLNKIISQNHKIMVENTVSLCLVGIVRAPAFILAHLPLLLIQYMMVVALPQFKGYKYISTYSIVFAHRNRV